MQSMFERMGPGLQQYRYASFARHYTIANLLKVSHYLQCMMSSCTLVPYSTHNHTNFQRLDLQY